MHNYKSVSNQRKISRDSQVQKLYFNFRGLLFFLPLKKKSCHGGFYSAQPTLSIFILTIVLLHYATCMSRITAGNNFGWIVFFSTMGRNPVLFSPYDNSTVILLEARNMRSDRLQLFMTRSLANIIDSNLENRWPEPSPSIAIINLEYRPKLSNAHINPEGKKRTNKI